MIESRHINNIVAEMRREQLDLITPHVYDVMDAVHRRPGMRRAVRRLLARTLVLLGATIDREALAPIALTRPKRTP
jgi:hypothetical protein